MRGTSSFNARLACFSARRWPAPLHGSWSAASAVRPSSADWDRVLCVAAGEIPLPVRLHSGVRGAGLELRRFGAGCGLVRPRGRGAWLLTGSGNPSASINLVRKHAVSRDLTGTVSVGGGDFNKTRSVADVTVPLRPEGTARARVVGVYRDGESDMERYSLRKKIGSAIVDANLTDSTLCSQRCGQRRLRFRTVRASDPGLECHLRRVPLHRARRQRHIDQHAAAAHHHQAVQ